MKINRLMLHYAEKKSGYSAISSISFKQKNNSECIKVSVILPIYNQEKYLEKALNCLQNQTLKEVEFICVNDGSEDKSLEILSQYAQKDKRIKVLNQNNQGAGPARNNGLKLAKGEYIAFLDPDDWIEKDALDVLYKHAKEQDSDMLVFNFNKERENGEIISQFNLKKRLQKYYDIKENGSFNWRDIKPKVFGGMYPVAWNKFYKRDFIRNNKLHFTNCSLAEDNVFVFGATLNAKKIGYLEKPLYHYIIHEGSAIRSKSDKNFALFKSIDSVKKLLKTLGLAEELEKEFDSYVLRIVSFHMKQINSIDKFKEVCKKRLTILQNQMLNERYLANSKIMPIINSVLSKNIKI